MEQNHNQFLLFMGEEFYPCGGWEDFAGFFKELEHAINFALSKDNDFGWAHAVYEGKIVWKAKNDPVWTKGYWKTNWKEEEI